MAKVFPFKPYRYTRKAGAPLANLVTQPYDKISPEMQERYLGSSPYNLVRVILGKAAPGDNRRNNVYTRAASLFKLWRSKGVLAQDAKPSFYPYFQEFTDPDSGARLTRKGFIGLGKLEEYSAGVVHRHEQTLSGPKKDRLEVLRHTHAHFGQIFVLYPDPKGAVDEILDEAALHRPAAELTDEYAAVHRLWKVSNSRVVKHIQELMRDRKLIIADGHHRYETALNFSKECSLAGARRVMMTFVNMHSAGLRILATHRLVNNLAPFNSVDLLGKLQHLGKLSLVNVETFQRQFARQEDGRILIGVALAGQEDIHVLESPRGKGVLDAAFLHQRILDGALGIGERAVREQKHLSYMRGIPAALDAMRAGRAQACFLLQPARMEEVAEVSFGGGVMPQKSTDFYPKLLTGMTIYRLER